MNSLKSPSDSFSSGETDALSQFVDDGGAVFLHDQSDFRNFDQTENLNGVAAALDVGFRFNDDQVLDDDNNEGAPFGLLTSAFNTDEFPYVDSSLAPVGAAYPYLAEWGERASRFAGRELPVGTRATLTFDPQAQVYDDFGRLLGSLSYDASANGSRDTLYNAEAIRQGYARVYGSSFSRHDEFWAVEDAARTAGTGIWAASNPDELPPIRDRPVDDLFVPNPASIVRDGKRVPPGHIRVFASATAEQERAETTYKKGIPLGAVDKNANVAYLGAPLISEDYEFAEGYPMDTASYENFAFMTNLIDEVSKTDGAVLVDGGHNQFGLDYALSSEDAAYYQRYLEGVDTAFEQVNDVTTAAASDRFDEAKALIVTTPRFGFTDAEVDAISSFADDGGAVVLMGSGHASPAKRTHLNGLASGIGSDLRLGSGRVRDEKSNLNDDPNILTTERFGPGRGNGKSKGKGNNKANRTDEGESKSELRMN